MPNFLTKELQQKKIIGRGDVVIQAIPRWQRQLALLVGLVLVVKGVYAWWDVPFPEIWTWHDLGNLYMWLRLALHLFWLLSGFCIFSVMEEVNSSHLD